MTIKTGERIPSSSFHTMTSDGPAKITTEELFDGKKVILVAVPGAFTPTCHASHLPGFVENADAIKERGVDTIAITSVNDVHVMGAWEKASGAAGKIVFLADGNGEFAKSVGLDIDLGVAGMGVRSKRYAMIVNNGVVEYVSADEAPGQVVESSAARILELL